ncbi:unnamed protein product [Boreogadus saida]
MFTNLCRAVEQRQPSNGIWSATSFKSKQSKDLSLPRYRAFVISATGIASDASRCTPCSDGGKALYNVVPPNIKSLTTVTTFKPALDVFLNSFPDTPPTPGYTGQNRNSVLEWAEHRRRAGAGRSLREQQATQEVGWLTNKTPGHIIAQRIREGRGTALFRQML